MSHAEDIKTALYEADNALNGDESGVVSQVKSAYNALNGISKVMPKTAELTERLDSCRIELKDIADEVSQLLERTDFNPAELDNINNRLDRLYELEKKYHAETVEELIQQRDDLKLKLSHIENSDEAVSEMEKEVAKLRSLCAQRDYIDHAPSHCGQHAEPVGTTSRATRHAPRTL